MIVLEGADSSGKSTLARKIHQRFSLSTIQMSEGPPKSFTEINDRVWRYLNLPNDTIFDRFPVITDQIYSSVLKRSFSISLTLCNAFWSRRPTIIYCRAPTGFLAPQEGPHDSPEHVFAVEQAHHKIREAYQSYFEAIDAIPYTWNNEEQVLEEIARRVGS